ncbi:SMI1/KNR4 family protein [Streptomyces sp. A30]|uniref:SMI1/KNR4 family protein n=1 Tax=Streptomyces sp. A30 TaxID=2789273 RepID=UPI00397F0A9A
MTLPTDYREFIETYGGGEIDECLSISTPPVPESAYGDLLDGMDPALRIEDSAALASYLPGGTPPRLLAFGATAGGDVVHWLCVGPADTWRVATFRRQALYGTSPWTVFDGGMAEFVLAAFAGTIEPFSERFLSRESHHYLNWRDA